MKVIIVDGVIGAGKTFSLKTLKQVFSDLPIIFEPVDKYRTFSFNGKFFNPLEEYYLNPYDNAVCSQLHIIKSLEEVILENTNDCNIVMERFLTSVDPFVKTMLELDILSEFSANFLLKKLSETLNKFSDIFEISKIIFLDTEIDLCLKRWKERNFREEQNFFREDMKVYLEKLRENYLKYYSENFPDLLQIVKNNDLECIVQNIEKKLD